MKIFPELMEELNEPLGSSIDDALAREAVRRPRSRFSAACLTPPQSDTAIGIIDEAIEQLQFLKHQILKHAE